MPWSQKTHSERLREKHGRPPPRKKRIRYKRAEAFYKSPRWRRLRRMILNASPVCLDPFGIHGGRVVEATDVDHIVPLREDWSKSLDPDNLRPLCRSCHSIVTGMARRRTRG